MAVVFSMGAYADFIYYRSDEEVTDRILYASDDSPESIQEARDYIKREQFTSEDVRLVKRAEQTLVIAKRAPSSWQPN